MTTTSHSRSLIWFTPQKRMTQYPDYTELNATSESEYFEKAGKVLGVIGTGISYHLPVVRHLPFYWRLAAALVPGYILYKWGQSTKEELLWGRST
jgi:hypothetical protein